MNDSIILEAERKRRTGISRTTAWRLEKEDKFPKRRIVSAGLVGWLESEINDWVTNRQVAV